MDPVLWTCWVLHQERTEDPWARAGAVRPPARGPDIARLGTARHQPACTEWITLLGPVLRGNKSEHTKLWLLQAVATLTLQGVPRCPHKSPKHDTCRESPMRPTKARETGPTWEEGFTQALENAAFCSGTPSWLNNHLKSRGADPPLPREPRGHLAGSGDLRDQLMTAGDLPWIGMSKAREALCSALRGHWGLSEGGEVRGSQEHTHQPPTGKATRLLRYGKAKRAREC